MDPGVRRYCYDTSPNPVNFVPLLAVPGGNVQSQMSGAGKPTSALIRVPFTMSAPGAISSLRFRVQSDDGFVAWLNGTEIVADNLTPDRTAAAGAGSSMSRVFPVPATALHPGLNLLSATVLPAVKRTNLATFSFDCVLEAK